MTHKSPMSSIMMANLLGPTTMAILKASTSGHGNPSWLVCGALLPHNSSSFGWWPRQSSSDWVELRALLDACKIDLERWTEMEFTHWPLLVEEALSRSGAGAKMIGLHEKDPGGFTSALVAMVGRDMDGVLAFLEGMGIAPQDRERVSLSIALEIAACLVLRDWCDKGLIALLCPGARFTIEFVDECLACLGMDVLTPPPSDWRGIGPLTAYMYGLRLGQQSWWATPRDAGQDGLQRLMCKVSLDDEAIDFLAAYLVNNQHLIGRHACET
jgi:hypothetical protein